MIFETLESLTYDQLKAVVARSYDLLTTRDRQRKDKAIEDARALLASAGLTLRDLGKKVSKPATGFKPKAGHTYQHPDNPALTCLGTGNKPKWWHDALKAGKEPIDLGAVRKVAA